MQLPAVALGFGSSWVRDRKTYYLDAEGFWLKKVNVAKCNDKKIGSFIVRMYINRAKISIAEQGERRKGTRGRAGNTEVFNGTAKKDIKHRSQKRGRRCAVATCIWWIQITLVGRPRIWAFYAH